MHHKLAYCYTTVLDICLHCGVLPGYMKVAHALPSWVGSVSYHDSCILMSLAATLQQCCDIMLMHCSMNKSGISWPW